MHSARHTEYSSLAVHQRNSSGAAGFLQPSSSTTIAERRLRSVASHLLHASAATSPFARMSASPTSGDASASASAAASDPTTPKPLGVAEDASAALSSRQLPLFQEGNTQLRKADKTDIVIDDIVVHSIPRIHDHLPNLAAYPNRFARTKASMQAYNAGYAYFTPASSSLSSSNHNNNRSNPSAANVPQHAHGFGTGLGPQIATSGGLSPSASGVFSAAAAEEVHYSQLIKEGDVVLLDIVRRGAGAKVSSAAKSFVRAGPREHICWAPGEAVAAIVTCGGLCPGLNDVIAELFNTLYYNYGVSRVHGIRSGFRGFYDPRFMPWLDLTPDSVRGIDAIGGTVLGSSRGGFNLEAIMQACMNRGVNQLYIVGGDGTHRAADIIQQEARRRRIKMTVACVPKTIDNDIGIIDRSFGFNTACGEARKAIQSAVVEASCAPNGLGIVQLMGRHAGYISAHATLASRQVDLCLIPEVSFPLEGPHGVLALVEGILARQGYGVIVVAEGAGTDLLPTIGTDESGNKKLPEVGKYLQSEIASHFARKKMDVSIKYHDPSYMIRSVPADASDAVYCMTLAQNAVHGAMCGFTGFTSGLVNNRTVYIPIPAITATSPSYLNPGGRTWERVLSLTHQPSAIWERLEQEKCERAKAQVIEVAAAKAH